MNIPNAIYPSPNLRYDQAAREVIFERLNPETGDVVFQVPSRETLREEAHAAAIGTGPSPVAPSPAPATNLVAPPDAAAVHVAQPPPKPGAGAGISILV